MEERSWHRLPPHGVNFVPLTVSRIHKQHMQAVESTMTGATASSSGGRPRQRQTPSPSPPAYDTYDLDTQSLHTFSRDPKYVAIPSRSITPQTMALVPWQGTEDSAYAFFYAPVATEQVDAFWPPLPPVPAVPPSTGNWQALPVNMPSARRTPGGYRRSRYLSLSWEEGTSPAQVLEPTTRWSGGSRPHSAPMVATQPGRSSSSTTTTPQPPKTRPGTAPPLLHRGATYAYEGQGHSPTMGMYVSPEDAPTSQNLALHLLRDAAPSPSPRHSMTPQQSSTDNQPPNVGDPPAVQPLTSLPSALLMQMHNDRHDNGYQQRSPSPYLNDDTARSSSPVVRVTESNIRHMPTPPPAAPALRVTRLRREVQQARTQEERITTVNATVLDACLPPQQTEQTTRLPPPHLFHPLPRRPQTTHLPLYDQTSASGSKSVPVDDDEVYVYNYTHPISRTLPKGDHKSQILIDHTWHTTIPQ
eukprot:TRINITY_DN61030_c0_g1_i1.p1 TRINITY_DN61030_c0_g1~~TRINITY_DN61030_c0_g1_i1.p1  ORF type:complete len:472 (+),score=11.29 TRINITY_DN61030_c0_g1_i1:29-1444(+)